MMYTDKFGKPVIDLHIFLYDGNLCFLHHRVTSWHEHHRLIGDYFKERVQLKDATIYVSWVMELEDYTPEQLVHMVAKYRQENLPIQAIGFED